VNLSHWIHVYCSAHFIIYVLFLRAVSLRKPHSSKLGNAFNWNVYPAALIFPLFSLCVQQIRDTVELWRLPNQRKISLRFLASYILKEDIQVRVLLAIVVVYAMLVLTAVSSIVMRVREWFLSKCLLSTPVMTCCFTQYAQH
jgi:uncharacterized membrane protein YhaH (DUF805 family)